MSRPRKPYGANPPGRLMGTMIKVLAAEMSDQGRLSRGKRYWADDAVIDIVVGHGAVTAQIQGSRPESYVVTIEAAGGEGVPTRRELWAQCTCPDDTGTGVDLCKHAVAAMFALADEVTLEPELIDRWRAGRRSPAADNVTRLATPPPVADGDDDDRNDHDDDDDDAPGADVIQLRPGHEPGADAISMMLRSPAGAAPPEFPTVELFDHGLIRDRQLADVLADALDHLMIRWE